MENQIFTDKVALSEYEKKVFVNAVKLKSWLKTAKVFAPNYFITLNHFKLRMKILETYEITDIRVSSVSKMGLNKGFADILLILLPRVVTPEQLLILLTLYPDEIKIIEGYLWMWWD